MEKLIGRWSYWGGIAGVIASVVWRILVTFALLPPSLTPSASHAVTYKTVMMGALMLLAITVASSAYRWLQMHKE